MRIKKEEAKKQCGFLKNERSPGPGEIYGDIKHESSKLNNHLNNNSSNFSRDAPIIIVVI